MLPADMLSNIGATFYERHKFHLPPRMEPSGRLVSRVTREMTQHKLEVRDFWKVHSVESQKTSKPA